MIRVPNGFWLGLAFGFFTTNPLAAFTYEVLFENTIGRDAVQIGRLACTRIDTKAILLDGQVETSGTETINYDRSVFSYLQIMQQIALGTSAALRTTLPLLLTYDKQEGGQSPRQISESSWLESKPKIELIYATQNALDLILGLDFYYISAHKYETQATNFTAQVSFKLSGEKSREITKSTSQADSVYVVEDRVYDPTTISIFGQGHLGVSQVYMEFSAIEASGGGNRTDRGATIKEDYFRTQLTGMFPLGGKDLLLESSLIYKSLSYADSRNVSFDTIPMVGFHLKLHLNPGVPLYAGIVGLRGSDRQSIPEFNANYKLFGIGAVAGTQFSF
ncbi:MAG: hypothetical protein NTX25_05195 [Proteobacteria bacterium]|nr:hypothetical protein [Pseudomonadota bacterium]